MTFTADLVAHVEHLWSHDIEPALHDYIRIPNVSPNYDAQWAEHGHMDAAVELIRRWCALRRVAGMSVEVCELEDRTPMLIIDVAAFNGGSDSDPVLLYGHLDKQPEMVGWRDGLGPWTPVVEGDRLYGRGGADDGYSAFASLAAIEAAQVAGMTHNRCVILIEASEESGSPDLPAYIDALRHRLGSPSLVLCLDSGCLDYERLWATTSLRGLASCTATVSVLTEGVHSGEASGVVPSSFRVLRQLLDRLEDSHTGRVLLADLHVDIPADRRAEARATAAEFAEPIATHFPFIDATQPVVADPAEQLIARTWEPTLSTTGVAGIPDLASAGNVLRPSTSLHLSFRLPPTCDDRQALRSIVETLQADPPYQATVTISEAHSAPGWNAPPFTAWLDEALTEASQQFFGRSYRAYGEGGTIPFMGMLGSMFPDAQFVITGVLGPGTNAHGPNEYLHLPTGRRVTACLAQILHRHATRRL